MLCTLLLFPYFSIATTLFIQWHPRSTSHKYHGIGGFDVWTVLVFCQKSMQLMSRAMGKLNQVKKDEMKNVFWIIIFCLLHQFCHAQWGVSMHQSNLPFFGVNYEWKEKFLSEFRVGTDNYLEDTSYELTLNYFLKKEEHLDVYAGLGARIQILEGIVLPLGMNIYPLKNKNFGFHIELAGIIDDSILLRGSWGIRYRFLKDEE